MGKLATGVTEVTDVTDTKSTPLTGPMAASYQRLETVCFLG